MRPVMQSRRDLATGDCLNACLASILELELRDVPDFAIYEDNEVWWKAAQDFCFSHGFQLWRIELARQVAWYWMPAQPLLILVGPTAKGAPHACVGYAKSKTGKAVEFMVIHDPLGGDGIETVDAVMFLVPTNPATQSRLLVDIKIIKRVSEAKTSMSRRLEDITDICAAWERKTVDDLRRPPYEIFFDDEEANKRNQASDEGLADKRVEQERQQEVEGQ